MSSRIIPLPDNKNFFFFFSYTRNGFWFFRLLLLRVLLHQLKYLMRWSEEFGAWKWFVRCHLIQSLNSTDNHCIGVVSWSWKSVHHIAWNSTEFSFVHFRLRKSCSLFRLYGHIWRVFLNHVFSSKVCSISA